MKDVSLATQAFSCYTIPVKQSRYQSIFFPILIMLVALVVALGLTQHQATSQMMSSQKPVSRVWMEYAEQLVKKEMPFPPVAARFYAFVSSVYADVVYATGDSLQASEATRQIINQLYPEKAQTTDTFFVTLTKQSRHALSSKATNILAAYKTREMTDGERDIVWDGVIPVGEGKWVKTNKQPLSPTAGQWKRWIVDDGAEFTIPAPPVYNSPEDVEELRIVTKAAAERDPVWNKKIIFWQGIPGTESPAGIWQNILYTQVKDSLINDATYSLEQKVVAQSIADAFLECWDVKYRYWTARPDMRIPGLKTSMPDPAFPSYPSGHATISAAAATVLSSILPDKKDYWMRMAREASDSRLYAGIHFKVDTDEGFALGQQVGTAVVKKLSL